MVGLVDGNQVPVGGDGMGLQLRARLEQRQAAQHQLLALKGVFLRRLGQALGVEQGEVEIEAAQHLYQPLVQQAGGHQYQHATGAAGQQLLVDDHARLDGLAQPHLVRQQYPGRVALTHLIGDVNLVRQQAGARAHQPAGDGALQAIAVGEGRHPQRKLAALVEVAVEEALLWGRQLDKGVEFQFGDSALLVVVIVTRIQQQTLLLGHPGDQQFNLVDGGDTVPDLEAQAGERGTLGGVGAFLRHGGEGEGNPPAVNVDDNTQAQLRIRMTDPALSDNIFHQPAPKKMAMLLR